MWRWAASGFPPSSYEVAGRSVGQNIRNAAMRMGCVRHDILIHKSDCGRVIGPLLGSHEAALPLVRDLGWSALLLEPTRPELRPVPVLSSFAIPCRSESERRRRSASSEARASSVWSWLPPSLPRVTDASSANAAFLDTLKQSNMERNAATQHIAGEG